MEMHLIKLPGFLTIYFCLCTLTYGAQVEITIHHEAEGKPLIMDSLRYRTDRAEQYSVSRLSYFLSGFTLESAGGNAHYSSDKVAWMDLEKRRQSIILDGVPDGLYKSIRFFIGLNPVQNHSDPSSHKANDPLNPAMNGLHWNWQGGYIFMALEGRYRLPGGDTSGYSFHLARDANRTSLDFPIEMCVQNFISCEFLFDIGTLLTQPAPFSFSEHGNSTHSHDGDQILNILKTNLSDAFQFQQLTMDIPRLKSEKIQVPIDLPAKVTPYGFKISRYFPIPNLPQDNPLIHERISLGERLFHEPALSRDEEISCASCHHYGKAFADTSRFSHGVDGREGTRNAMPLFNLAWKSSFFWDGRAPTLRAQALMPIEDHLEMDESLENIVQKLSSHKDYPSAFEFAFGSPLITPERIGLALENFLLTLVSSHSRFDDYLKGKTEFSASEKRGFELFMTEYEPRSGRFGADCFHCHGGALFTDNAFHNNGLDMDPVQDSGRYMITSSEADRGKFMTPSLRNVALTAPYMHDGRFETLEEVVAHYNSGVARSPSLDPNLAKHPAAGINLSRDDQKAIVDFLLTLSDEQFTNP